MSEYESLRTDIDGLASSMENYTRAVSIFTEAATGEIKRLWTDNAELRDELHAVSNRLENLTRAMTTSPAEVAESMLNARTGQPLVLAGRPGDAVDCVSCCGSGTTPIGGKCAVCDGFGQVRK